MNTENAAAELEKGNQLLGEEKLEEAIAAYRRAIELNPDLSWSHHNLGEALAKLGQLDEAIAAYHRAIELNPDFSWSYHHLGDALDRQQQWEEAVVAFRRAIELNPQHFGSYCGLGQGLLNLGQLDEAAVAYRRASELEPAADWIQYRLREVLQQRTQLDLERAIDTFRHALEQNPKSDECYYNLGEALAAYGNATEASLCYYKAFKLNSNNMQANQKRPRIYDCFAFFNELDVLRIRIEELKDVVDKFILVEATKTFSGNPKPLYYQEFIHEFAEYQDKIIHYVVDDMPEIDYSLPVHLQAWPLDVHQKNCISRVLNSLDCKDEDIILVNDCDEIPRKEKLTEAIELLKDNEFVIFVQDLYHGHLDNLFSEWWCGTVACKYKDFKVRTYTKVRYSDKIHTGLDMGDPAYKRAGYINSNQYFEHPYIVKSGWSFSRFGSELSRRYKLQSFAHKEVDDSQARGLEKIKYDLCRPTLEMESSGEFYFDIRDINGKDVPEFLRNNIPKYRHFLQPRQTALMAKLGGEFKQADIHLETLKNEISQVKNQLEKGMQNLLKVCDSLAEKGELVEAIAQWRQVVARYPELTSQKCFLSNLDGIKTCRINPEDLTLISGQLIPTQTGNQLVSQTGNHGQICYGPYISLPEGLYRVKIDLEKTDFSGGKGNEHEQVWFKFDVAVNKGLVIHEANVYNHQTEHEFFIDVNAQELEIRFWATGMSFAVSFIELTLIYQTDLQKDIKVEPEVNLSIFNQTGEFNVIKRFINQGQTVFDIGANVGGWTEEVLNAVSDIEVHLFEAVPKIYHELIRNISSKNPCGNLIPNNCAVSKTDGVAQISYYPDSPQWSTIYRRSLHVESSCGLQPPQSVEVLATTIDGYCNRLAIKRIHFLKIDVEGAELDVLSGAINSLKSGRIDYIQFEYGGTYLDAGTTLEQIFALLAQYRYSIFKILPDQLEYLPNFNPNYEDFQFSNFLAVNERFRSVVLGEPPEQMLNISQLCREHSVIPTGVIHVGAHEGGELKTYQEMGIKQVLFIEANPDIAERLKKRMAGMSQVQVVNCAISNQNGTVELIITNNEMSSSILPLKVHGEIYPTIQVTHKLTVEAKTLDTLLEEMQLQASDFNILNIDIQGAELLAFQGATNLLKYIEIINTEVNYEELYEGCALIDQIDDFLEAYGFERKATTTPYHPTWGDACYVKKPLITMSTLGSNGHFGNQIFQYAFLKIYAKQHNLRVETPEWVGRYLFGHNDPIISRQLPIVEEKHPIVPAQIPYQKEPYENVDFWGYFQYRTTFYAPHKEYLRSLFKPVQEVEAIMKVAMENLNARGKTLIGIHLRRGDIKNHPLHADPYYYPAPTEWYKDWLRDIWENIEQPVLFVASDSLEEVINDFAEFQPVTVKELGVDLPPASFYPDFYLLSHCELVAISNSSFSFTTCLLNEKGKLFYRPCRKREKLIPFFPWDSYALAEAVRMY